MSQVYEKADTDYRKFQNKYLIVGQKRLPKIAVGRLGNPASPQIYEEFILI